MRTYRAPGLGTTLRCPTGTIPSPPEATTCVLRYSPCAISGRTAPMQRASVGLKRPDVRETLLIRPLRQALYCAPAREQSVIRAVLWPFEPHAPATTMIEEDADDGSDQTQDTDNGRRGGGDGCRAANIRSAERARRSRTLLREGPRS